MLRLMLAMITVAALAAPAQTETTAAWDLNQLGWLAGTWTGTQDGVQMEELWMPPQGGALLGLHRDIKQGRMVSFEFFRIATTPEGTFYFASPRSAPPTPFRLVKLEGRRVEFENPAHDFPQRVLYWLDDGGALHARIEGPMDGKPVAEEWTWTRAR